MSFSVPAQGTMMKSFASKVYLTVINALFCLGTMRKSDGETAKHVRRAPSPLPADAPAPPPPERVWQITLCYREGRQPPVTYGIDLNGKVTCREILSTLEQTVHVAENEELVLAIVRDMRCRRCVSFLDAFLLL